MSRTDAGQSGDSPRFPPDDLKVDFGMSVGQSDTSSGMRMDVDRRRQEVTLHVGPEDIALLRQALDDVERGGKVFIGDKPLLIIRPVGWGDARCLNPA